GSRRPDPGQVPAGDDQGPGAPRLPARRHLRRGDAALPRRGVRAVAVDLRRLPPGGGPGLPEGGARPLPPAPGGPPAMSDVSPAVLAVAAFVLPCAVSWLLTAVLIRVAPRLGLVDHPGARKVHTKPTPRGGGLAIYAAVALAACLDPGGLDRRRLLL